MHRNRVPTQRVMAAFTLIELLVVIAIIAIIAAILFPVFGAARDKARQAVCLSNLKQTGTALSLYVQDYDERLPICCSFGRSAVSSAELTGVCFQVGITRATPLNTYLGPEQTPPRYIQELLHPYVRNAQIWFCPSEGKDSHVADNPTLPTYGYNGTTYAWHWYVDPTLSTDPNPFRKRAPIWTSAMAIADIPKPAEAPLMWDFPVTNPVKEPCTRFGLKPAHAKGLNVLYADSHAKFSPFSGRPTLAWSPCEEIWLYEHGWEGFYE
jgi:prepilin-type N-terminal cleavage/methylation domain-containing protein/prepilin-type processing-associated H-X9-DG protein